MAKKITGAPVSKNILSADAKESLRRELRNLGDVREILQRAGECGIECREMLAVLDEAERQMLAIQRHFG
jgi:hypothetical protein